MPITPFIGVRISWLMLARNCDLARLPASAAWTAAASSAASRSLRSLPAIASTTEAWAPRRKASSTPTYTTDSKASTAVIVVVADTP